MEELLSVKDLSVSFPATSGSKEVLRDVSFSIRRGEVVGLVGESGSGKTMIARAITRLLPPNAEVTNGEIVFEGHDLLCMSERTLRTRYRGKRISIVFQDAVGSFNPPAPVSKHMQEMFKLHTNVPRRQIRTAAVRLLEHMHVPDAADKYDSIAGLLSGGQAQRINIALMGMITKPDLLVVDEATTALDVTVQAQVLNLLMEVAHANNITLLFITHDFGLVAEYADRVVILEHGSVVEEGMVEDIFYRPQSEYTRTVLERLPRMDGRMRSVQPDSAADTVLRIEGLHVAFPIFSPSKVVLQKQRGATRAVDGVSLTLHRGEILGVVGESGCGKTTLMRSIMGVVPRDAEVSGSVMFGDTEILGAHHAAMRSVRQRVGAVPQNPRVSLNPRMRIVDLIAEGMDVHDLYKASGGAARDEERVARVAQLMRDVGLDEDRMRDFPPRLSGGELQRVAIARALATDPEVLILDEPTASLDTSRKKVILELLLRLQRERGLAYILITHELPVVANICDMVAVMYLGRIVEQGRPEAVFSTPAHPYTKALVSSVPIPDPRGARERIPLVIPGEVPSANHIPTGCRFRTRCPLADAQCELQEPNLGMKGTQHLAACHYSDRVTPNPS